MFLGFPSLQQIREANGEGRGRANSRQDSKVKSKLAAWCQGRGPKQTSKQTSGNKKKKIYYERVSKSPKAQEFEVIASGNSHPLLWAPELLICSFQRGLLRILETGGSLGHSNKGWREETDTRGRGAQDSVSLWIPPSTGAALLHSALLPEASSMKGSAG